MLRMCESHRHRSKQDDGCDQPVPQYEGSNCLQSTNTQKSWNEVRLLSKFYIIIGNNWDNIMLPLYIKIQTQFFKPHFQGREPKPR